MFLLKSQLLLITFRGLIKANSVTIYFDEIEPDVVYPVPGTYTRNIHIFTHNSNILEID